MATSIEIPASTLEPYRDGKFATWAIYSPKLDGVPVTYWQGITDGYGHKVTIISSSKESLVKKIEDYATKTERKLSPIEADSIRNMGLYAAGAGAITAVLGHVAGFQQVRTAGGAFLLGGAATAGVAMAIKPATVGKDEIVLDTNISLLGK
jgi:hypothetical protein